MKTFKIKRTDTIEFMVEAKTADEALQKAKEYVPTTLRKIIDSSQTHNVLCAKCGGVLTNEDHAKNKCSWC